MLQAELKQQQHGGMQLQAQVGAHRSQMAELKENVNQSLKVAGLVELKRMPEIMNTSQAILQAQESASAQLHAMREEQVAERLEMASLREQLRESEEAARLAKAVSEKARAEAADEHGKTTFEHSFYDDPNVPDFCSKLSSRCKKQLTTVVRCTA